MVTLFSFNFRSTVHICTPPSGFATTMTIHYIILHYIKYEVVL